MNAFGLTRSDRRGTIATRIAGGIWVAIGASQSLIVAALLVLTLGSLIFGHLDSDHFLIRIVFVGGLVLLGFVGLTFFAVGLPLLRGAVRPSLKPALVSLMIGAWILYDASTDLPNYRSAIAGIASLIAAVGLVIAALLVFVSQDVAFPAKRLRQDDRFKTKSLFDS